MIYSYLRLNANMDTIQVIPNVIKNYSQIIEYVTNKEFQFKCRKTEQVFANMFGSSFFSTLESKFMDNTLLSMILENIPENKYDYSFIQIQKYTLGQYILPHKDNYTCLLRLFTLTTSNIDGFCTQNGDSYTVIPDVAGQEIKFDLNAWHWVNPVRDPIRYSLVVGL